MASNRASRSLAAFTVLRIAVVLLSTDAEDIRTGGRAEKLSPGEFLCATDETPRVVLSVLSLIPVESHLNSFEQGPSWDLVSAPP